MHFAGLNCVQHPTPRTFFSNKANIGEHKRTFSHSTAPFSDATLPCPTPPQSRQPWPSVASVLSVAFSDFILHSFFLHAPGGRAQRPHLEGPRSAFISVIRGQNFGFPVPGAFHRPLRVYELRLAAFIASIAGAGAQHPLLVEAVAARSARGEGGPQGAFRNRWV